LPCAQVTVGKYLSLDVFGCLSVATALVTLFTAIDNCGMMSSYSCTCDRLMLQLWMLLRDGDEEEIGRLLGGGGIRNTNENYGITSYSVIFNETFCSCISSNSSRYDNPEGASCSMQKQRNLWTNFRSFCCQLNPPQLP
jgi:hypothetical protein